MHTCNIQGGISGPPPSYGTEADAAPPTYDQAVGKVVHMLVHMVLFWAFWTYIVT